MSESNRAVSKRSFIGRMLGIRGRPGSPSRRSTWLSKGLRRKCGSTLYLWADANVAGMIHVLDRLERRLAGGALVGTLHLVRTRHHGRKQLATVQPQSADWLPSIALNSLAS